MFNFDITGNISLYSVSDSEDGKEQSKKKVGIEAGAAARRDIARD